MSYSNGPLQSNTNNVTGVKGPKGDDGVGFKLTSSGDFDINGKAMYNIKTQAEFVPDDSDFESIKRDYESGVNKEYLINHFFKRDKTGVFYDLRGLSIQNSEDFDQNSSNNKTLINKGYVDSSIHLANTMNRDHIETVKAEVDLKLANKADLQTSTEQTFNSIINVPNFDQGYSNMSNVMNKGYIDSQDVKKADKTDVLLRNGDNKMSASLDMNNQYINNLSTPSTHLQGANKAYVDLTALSVLGENKMLSNLNVNEKKKITNLQDPSADSDAVNKKFAVDLVNQDKIKQSVIRKNVLSFTLNRSLWKTEFKTRNLSLIEKDFKIHHINLHLVSFEINREVKPETNGLIYWYRGRVSINCGALNHGEYTIVCELFPHWNINTELFIQSTSINVGNKTDKNFSEYNKYLIHIHKNSDHGVLYIDIDFDKKHDVPTDFNNEWVPCYLIFYGVIGYVENVDSSVYDSFMYFENDNIYFEKIVNMNDKQIINVEAGTNDKSVVNLLQLKNEIKSSQQKSYYKTIFEYFFDLLDPSNFIMSDSYGSVVEGVFDNLVFNPTKLLSDFDPKKGFLTNFEINFNENVTGSDEWTMYIAFKYDYKHGDNKRIKIELGNDGSFDFPWVKLESGKLFLDYDLDVYSKQIIRDAYIGEYLNLWYTKIAGQFRIAVCNNAISIDQTFSGFNINASNIKITSDYHVQRIGFSKSVYPINGKEYHKIQFLDKANGVFFE